MKEFIFNRKDYKSYKDMYEDIAKKTNSINIKDYFDSSNYDYNPNILWECLCCDYGFASNNIKLICLNFNKEKIALQKNFNDYNFNIILEVFNDFVQKFPNNQLEFIMEEE